jgi:hypothetical protein
MWLGEMHDHGVPRPRDAEHLHPDQGMEPPACGGVLPRLALWVGQGRVRVLEDLPEAVR